MASALLDTPPRRAAARRWLRAEEFPVPAVELARWLLGKTLLHETPEGRAGGRIVETEAYVVGDASGHAFRGMTARNRSLFLAHAHAYVYFIYGCWWSLNCSAEAEGVGAGVLIRALKPHTGIELMRRRRGGVRLEDLARGPGRLASALAIDRRQDGLPLYGRGSLRIERGGDEAVTIGESVRIGLTKEADRVLRFYERGNRFVSGPARLRA